VLQLLAPLQERVMQVVQVVFKLSHAIQVFIKLEVLEAIYVVQHVIIKTIVQ